jgi:hypothetical protein
MTLVAKPTYTLKVIEATILFIWEYIPLILFSHNKTVGRSEFWQQKKSILYPDTPVGTKRARLVEPF